MPCKVDPLTAQYLDAAAMQHSHAALDWPENRKILVHRKTTPKTSKS